MHFSKVCVVPAAIERLWDFMIEAESVSGCMPGIESFRPLGGDTFEGTVRLGMGPISLVLAGEVAIVERDRATWTAKMTATAKDVRVAGDVRAAFSTRLAPKGDGETELHIDMDARILGKLGEFGQPIMKKTAEKYLVRFVDNVAAALAASGTEPARPDAAAEPRPA